MNGRNKTEISKKSTEEEVIVPINPEAALHSFWKGFDSYRKLSANVPAQVFKLQLLYDFFFLIFIVMITAADKLTYSAESARDTIIKVYDLADSTTRLSKGDAKAVLDFNLDIGKHLPLNDWLNLLPPATFDPKIDSEENFCLPLPPGEKVGLFDNHMSLFPSITINDKDLEKYFNNNKKDIKRYFIDRYFLTDAIKVAAYTPFHIGIRSLTDNQLHQLMQASNNSKNSSMLLWDYYTKKFGISEEILRDGDIIDMTFGRKGIRRRMKNYFSLEPKSYANDPEAVTNCIRLAAYLKGTELKYGITIKRRVRKTLNFHLNSFFNDYLKGSERHPKLADIYKDIIPDMLYDVRSCCDIDFVLKCRDASEAIDEAVAYLVSFRTTSEGNTTAAVGDCMLDSNLTDIEKIISENDTAAVSPAAYNVWQEYYMFLISLTKKAQLAKKLDMCSFDEIVKDLCERHERLPASNLINIGVQFTKSGEDYAKIYTSKKEAIKTAASDPAEEYFKESIMVRALDHYIDFADFLLMYRDSVVDFLCNEDDPVKKEKLQRRTKENLGNIVYFIKNVYGKSVNALDVFLCFYLYFSMSGINIRQNGYQSHDKKTIVNIINNEELSADDITVLRQVLQRLKSVALIGRESESPSHHYAKAMILAYISKQMQDHDLLTAGENITRLLDHINSCQNRAKIVSVKLLKYAP